MKKRLLAGLIIALFLMTSIVHAAPYNGNNMNGFGGAVGFGVLEINNNGDNLSLSLTKGAGDLNEWLVVYIDSVSGGITTTGNLIPDFSDDDRSAVTGAGSGALIFGSSFGADYAISFSALGGGRLFGFGLEGVSQLITNLGGNGNPSDPIFNFSTQLSDINIAAGDVFSFVGTYLNSPSGFRSNEGFSFPPVIDNPGFNDIPINSYFTHQSTVPVPGAVWLLASGLIGIVGLRRKI